MKFIISWFAKQFILVHRYNIQKKNTSSYRICHSMCSLRKSLSLQMNAWSCEPSNSMQLFVNDLVIFYVSKEVTRIFHPSRNKCDIWFHAISTFVFRCKLKLINSLRAVFSDIIFQKFEKANHSKSEKIKSNSLWIKAKIYLLF